MLTAQFLAVFAIAACLLLPVDKRDSFEISGTVVEHVSGRPLPNVMVIVSPVDHRDRGLSYVTAADGRFTFQNLAAGKYSLVASRRGFLSQAFQDGHDGFSTAIAVRAGQDSTNILFPLEVPGSISGTVLDDQGDPVRQAQIFIFHKAVYSGKGQILMEGAQCTDSSGEFTFSHLRPGIYLVGVQARPWYAQNPPPQSQPPGENEQDNGLSNLDVAYPVTYYPDTVDPASASAIIVREGSSSRIQITLRAVPAVRVEIPGNQTKPNAGLNVMTYATGPGGYPILVGAGNGAIMNNHQVIAGLAPGPYVISVQEFGEQGAGASRTIPLTVNENQSLNLESFSKTTLSGHIAVEGGDVPAGLTLVLASSAQNGLGPQAIVAQDGTFTAKGSTLGPGSYEIQLQNAPGIYLKSIEAKGAKVSGNEIEISEGASVRLSLIAAKGTVRIDGIASKDDKPFAGAMVLLIPKDRSRADFFRRDQSDSDGTFTLNDVPLGQYTLLAIDDGHDLAYREPSVIDSYMASGIALTVPLQNHDPVKVNVIQRHQ